MAIIRWNPWSLSRFLDEDLQLPTPFSNLGLGQGLNLYETENAIIAEAAVPGIPEDKIDVTVGKDGVVRISASAAEKAELKGEVRRWMNTMSRYINYSFKLPEGLVSDQEPVCELENGVLRLEFTKIQPEPPKKIQVKRPAK